ncbi:MAG: hypothetical protein COA79_00200 [Planctomycetota bacterium]|nr:MAG: hypothetical protein COA79_00200 [Planctomycetota bacterium]
MSEHYNLPKEMEYLIALKFTEEISEKQTIELATFVLENPQAKKKYYEIEGIRRLLLTSNKILPDLRLSKERRQVLLNKFNGVIVFPTRLILTIAAAALFAVSMGVVLYSNSQPAIENNIDNKIANTDKDIIDDKGSSDIPILNVKDQNPIKENNIVNKNLISLEVITDSNSTDSIVDNNEIKPEETVDVSPKVLVHNSVDIDKENLAKEQPKMNDSIAEDVKINNVEVKILPKEMSKGVEIQIDDNVKVIAKENANEINKERIAEIKKERRIHVAMIRNSGFYEYEISNLSSKNQKRFRVTSSMNLYKLSKGKTLPISQIFPGDHLVPQGKKYTIITNIDEINDQRNIVEPPNDEDSERDVKKAVSRPNIWDKTRSKRRSRNSLRIHFIELDEIAEKRKVKNSKKEIKFKDAIRLLYCVKRLHDAEVAPENKKAEIYSDVYDVFINVSNFKKDKHYIKISNKIIRKME